MIKQNIQRIQTVYLILAMVVTGVLPFVFPLWKRPMQRISFYHKINCMQPFSDWYLLSLLAILFYKKRQHQFVIGRLNIILNLILLGLFVYRSLNLSGETTVSERVLGCFYRLFLSFLVLANKAIKKDEDLVKSVDRLR
jgi:hypothetical protein